MRLRNFLPTLATLALVTLTQPLPAADPADFVQVIDAKWGAGDHQADVTKKMQDLAYDGHIFLAVNTLSLGDPIFGQPKELVLTYEMNGEKHTTHIKENTMFSVGLKLAVPEDLTDLRRQSKSSEEITCAQGWHRTDMLVEYGKCYKITAEGDWTGADGKTCGPDGICPAAAFSPLNPPPQLTPEQRDQFYFHGHPRDALIGQFSQAIPIRGGNGFASTNVFFLVGKTCTFIAPFTGSIAFKINDDEMLRTERTGKLQVKIAEVKPQWISPEGNTIIRASVRQSATLQVGRFGIFWISDGAGRAVGGGLNEPTIVNNIMWWPDWRTIANSQPLMTNDILPADTSRFRLVNGKSAKGGVTLDNQNGQILLRFSNDGNTYGDVGCAMSIPAPTPDPSAPTIYLAGKGQLVSYARNVNGMVQAPPAPPAHPASPPPTPIAQPTRPQRVAIDIPVTCAQPDPNAPAATTAPAGDPNAIERPEFRTKPHPLTKSITSATALVVTSTANGDLIGETTDIIATVNPDSRGGTTAGIGILRADGDVTMKTALEEAVRAVRLRYPIWEPGHIDISFGEKFVSHGGPSAGTVFALLMLSEIEGFDLDPKCAVTGDITVDWKVRKVGGVTAKLHGATLDKCLFAAIPEDNETAFADMGVLYGTSALYNIQVFSVATLQDAEAIARKDRATKLVQAIKLFDDLKTQLAKSEKPTLQKPETKKTLEKILELAPNHLSAKYLLAVANGTASKTLSANATLYRIEVILAPYWAVNSAGKRYSRETIPLGVTNMARKQIAALRPIANKDFLPFITDTSAFVETLEQFATGNSATPHETLVERERALDARFDELASDKDLRAKLMREGY